MPNFHYLNQIYAPKKRLQWSKKETRNRLSDSNKFGGIKIFQVWLAWKFNKIKLSHENFQNKNIQYSFWFKNYKNLTFSRPDNSTKLTII